MKKFYKKALYACITACVLNSCVDNNYDLGDIDTTIKVEVTDLMVPINLDEIKMASIFDINEGNDINVNANGDYEYRTDGSFESKSININPIFIDSPHINPSKLTSNIGDLNLKGALRSSAIYIPYIIKNSVFEQMKLESKGIDKSILRLSEVYTEAVLKIDIPISNFKAISESVKLSDFKIKLPTQLDVVELENIGCYDSSTGIYQIDEISFSTDSDIQLSLLINKITIKENEFDVNSHSINVDDELGVLAGSTIGVQLNNNIDFSALPTTLDFTINYSLTSINNPNGFNITAISGQIQYSIEELNIKDIDISNLPDIIKQSGTNLIFDNPRIYLHINNPLQKYNIYAHLDFEIQAIRGDRFVNYPLEGGFSIGKAPNVHTDGLYNFCLSPNANDIENVDYPNLIHVSYPALAEVLSGDGLPDKLKINVQNPEIPAQTVNKFELKDYSKIEGRYFLLAPLQLREGSQICYRDTVDGWNKDFEKLTIQKLRVTCNVTTNIPLDIDFSGFPIDKNRKQINNVQIKGAKIIANSTNMPLEIEITGEVKDLDGIIFEAIAKPGVNNSSLNENMTINLSNIRPYVTGYYIDEL